VPVLEEVMQRYPKDVRIVYRHLPLERIHPRARAAAEASACAQDQGKFWEYHDIVFANNRTLAHEDLRKFAQDSNLDVAAWDQCMAEQKFAAQVDADLEAGQAIGITGTPAFIINGRILTGARPIEEFVTVIESELERGAERDAS
jgi:protein-disulfide isomerase